MKILTLALGLAIAASSGMTQAASHEYDMSQQQMAMQPVASPAKHAGVGVLKAVNAKAGKVLIAHEAIADLGWPPMTMWFTLQSPLPVEIHAGDNVRFEMEQTTTNAWAISRIERKR